MPELPEVETVMRALAGRLSEKNILVSGTGTGTFPMQVNPTITRMAPEALARIFIDSAKA